MKARSLRTASTLKPSSLCLPSQVTWTTRALFVSVPRLVMVILVKVSRQQRLNRNSLQKKAALLSQSICTLHVGIIRMQTDHDLNDCATDTERTVCYGELSTWLSQLVANWQSLLQKILSGLTKHIRTLQSTAPFSIPTLLKTDTNMLRESILQTARTTSLLPCST